MYIIVIIIRHSLYFQIIHVYIYICIYIYICGIILIICDNSKSCMYIYIYIYILIINRNHSKYFKIIQIYIYIYIYILVALCEGSQRGARSTAHQTFTFENTTSAFIDLHMFSIFFYFLFCVFVFN